MTTGARHRPPAGSTRRATASRPPGGAARPADRGLVAGGRRAGPAGAAPRADRAGGRAAPGPRRAPHARRVSATGSPGSGHGSDAAFAETAPRPGSDRRGRAEPGRTPAATCCLACWRCRTTSSAATPCWPPSVAWVADQSARPGRRSWSDRGASTTPADARWRRWSPSTSSCTATTPRRAWRRSARSARCATTWSGSATPTSRPASPPPPARSAGPSGDAERLRPTRPRPADARRAVPHPPLPPRGRAGPGLRRPRRRARPRGRAEGDPPRQGRRGPTSAAGSCSRPRSTAAWSTPGSSRSTAWAPTTTAGRSTPCGSSRGTASRRPSRRTTRSTPGPTRAPVEFRKLLGRFVDVLRGDRLRAQPGGAAPRPEAAQRDAGPVRRDAADRLGPGQGDRPPRAGQRRRPPSRRRWCRPPAAGMRRRWACSARRRT